MPPTPATDPAHNKQVLIVDDSLTVVKSLAKILRKAGMKPIEALSGSEAFKKTQKAPPDLILLDLVMPEISGIEVLKQLRDDINLRSVPVIVITARKEEEQVTGHIDAYP